MPTGLNIRDFHKRYREVRYTDQGSIRLSEIEHNAYLNRLTIEVTHFEGYRANNFKSLPESCHWGYATFFKGSSVTELVPVKFAKQRVYEHINQGIWNHHQSSEDISIQRGFIQASTNAVVTLGTFEDAVGKTVEVTLEVFETLGDLIGDGSRYVIGYNLFSGDPPEDTNDTFKAFPVASPFPDVVKFKSDIPASFLLRLESWYLVNPAVYILSNPSDTSDETEDESEYPTPEGNDDAGSPPNFPPSSAPDPVSDPRDYSPGASEGSGLWRFSIRLVDPGNNPFCNNIGTVELALRGFPDELPRKEFTGPVKMPEGGRPGRYFTSVASAPFSGDCGSEYVGEAVFLPD